MTLIRADLGKTLMLEALAWGLGMVPFARSRMPFRLGSESGARTVVQVDFELSAGGAARTYRLTRTVHWRRDGQGDWHPDASSSGLADAGQRNPTQMDEVEKSAIEAAVRRHAIFMDDRLYRKVGECIEAALPSGTRAAVRRVNERMNGLLLRMVGQRESGLADVERAWIKADHRLAVSLAGAGRAADGLPARVRGVLGLTLALSELKACVFMDDVLGMLDVALARSVLEVASSGAGQLVLAVNPRPSSVDDVLDGCVGRSCTVSLADDYPGVLVNDPGVEQGTLACSCDHRGVCRKCERRV